MSAPVRFPLKTVVFCGAFAWLIPLVIAAPSNAEHTPPVQPLFESDTTVAATLKVSMSALLGENEEAAGPVIGELVLDAGEGSRSFTVELAKRGHSRLQLCDMPPLKLDFQRGKLDGTLLANQNKLKLVTHCLDERKFARYLELEYGIYRTYNQLTEESFRVRRLEVTYVDTDGWFSDKTRPAFLIEADALLAARLGYRELDIPEVPRESLDPYALTRIGLFQYLIGNTDWSILKGRGSDPCCHNGVLLERPSGERVIIPYDFDQAGLIDTYYALPAEGLGIRSVKERLFRGLCTGDERLDATVALFNERRPQIASLFPNSGAMKKTNKRVMRYVDSFYETINDPEELQSEIRDHCRGDAAAWGG